MAAGGKWPSLTLGLFRAGAWVEVAPGCGGLQEVAVWVGLIRESRTE